MLYEASLPPSFLGEAVNAYITVQNRYLTNSLPDKTPYELWYKRKPNVSNLRVWGCAAYVHIQKDKRSGIGSHMVKCIFIGYPEGYKAWKFYNPASRRVIISKHAEFDERYYPGLKHNWKQSETDPALPLIVSEYQTLIQTEDETHSDDNMTQPTVVSTPVPPMSPTQSMTPALDTMSPLEVHVTNSPNSLPVTSSTPIQSPLPTLLQ